MSLVAGVDEAGRGCIFGRVYAAAVIWNDSIHHPLLKDSKKLTKKQRSIMRDYILDNAIDYSIGYATHEEIDSLNILHATQKAMHDALNGLTLDIDHIYVDGNFFKFYKDVEHTCVIGGDNVRLDIAAASILAKTSHDLWIQDVVSQDPLLERYSLDKNMGYCTKAHETAVRTYGRSSYHRKTFKLPFEKLA